MTTTDQQALRNLERRHRITAALEAEGLLGRITGYQLDYIVGHVAEDLAVASARRCADAVTVIRHG